MAEGFVQVQPDSTGKKARTVDVDPPGAETTVHQQVVTSADLAGNLSGANVSGTLAAAGNTAALTLPAFAETVAVDLRGTWTAGTTVEIEGTLDDTNWAGLYVRKLYDEDISSGNGQLTSTLGTRTVYCLCGGLSQVRARMSARAGTDSLTVILKAGAARNPLVGVAFGTGDANAFLPGLSTRLLPNALTKGTQGSNGFPVQNYKDAGRSPRTYQLAETPATTEALRTTSRSISGATVSTGSSWAVTSGKICRIQSLAVTMTHTAVNFYKAFLRISDTGAVTTSSPFAAVAVVQNQATQGGGTAMVNFPDGLELSGTQQFGISTIGAVAAGSGTVSLITYEY